MALKIQFLRLIHSFCDHSDYKHLLMSKIEWDELNRIPSSPTPAVLRWFMKSDVNVPSKSTVISKKKYFLLAS